jgi:mRNA interferase MazF
MPESLPIPRRGEIWLLDFDPTRGHEQAGTRPALVLSVDRFNAGSANLVIVCPISSKNRSIRSHVVVEPPDGGLAMTSYIMTEHVRSVSRDRLVRRFGTLPTEALEAVEERLRILVGL